MNGNGQLNGPSGSFSKPDKVVREEPGKTKGNLMVNAGGTTGTLEMPARNRRDREMIQNQRPGRKPVSANTDTDEHVHG